MHEQYDIEAKKSFALELCVQTPFDSATTGNTCHTINLIFVNNYGLDSVSSFWDVI